MTTRAEVRAIYTSDMDELALYSPKDRELFRVSVRVMVGPKDGRGEESFDIYVCTPNWLAKACQTEGFVLGRHYLIVASYDAARIKRLITELVQKCEGSSWREVAEKVGRIGFWEFEDYTPKHAAAPLDEGVGS